MTTQPRPSVLLAQPSRPSGPASVGAAREDDTPGATQPRRGRVVAVGGGKGGIGKSLVSSSLGIELARRGQRVVLVDADLGGANLHTCLGVEPPKATLSDFVDRRVGRIDQIVVPTGVSGLALISGAMDSLDVANPSYAQKTRILRSLQALDIDFVVLDLGAGSSYTVLDFFLAADHGMLVLVPEPTSIENGYRFAKAAFFRRLATVQAQYGIEKIVSEAMTRRQEQTLRTPHDVVAAVRARDVRAGEKLEREMTRFRPRLVVNQARSDSDREVGNAVVAAWRKYFGTDMDYLGAVGYDDEVWKAVRKRRPVVLENPQGETSRAVARIADRLLSLDASLLEAGR